MYFKYYAIIVEITWYLMRKGAKLSPIYLYFMAIYTSLRSTYSLKVNLSSVYQHIPPIVVEGLNSSFLFSLGVRRSSLAKLWLPNPDIEECSHGSSRNAPIWGEKLNRLREATQL